MKCCTHSNGGREPKLRNAAPCFNGCFGDCISLLCNFVPASYSVLKRLHGHQVVTGVSENTPTLRTDRLVMRAPNELDIPAWFARATDHESAYLAGDPIPANISEGKAWLTRTRAKAAAGERLLWSIDIRKGPSSIGTVGLSVKMPAISFVIGRAFWRRGYATEAAREVLRFGLNTLNLSEVGSETVVNNSGSRRVLAKLGFQHVANFLDESDGAECERHVLYR